MITVIAAALGTASAAPRPAKIGVRSTALGAVLVDARKHTLYMFAKDTRSKSACYGTCATAWPPLQTASKPVAGPGVKPGLLGTITRRDGKLQVAYAGHPLYLFARDKSAGQTGGQGVGELWFVLTPAGKPIKNAASPPPPPSGEPPPSTPSPRPRPSTPPPPPPGY